MNYIFKRYLLPLLLVTFFSTMLPAQQTASHYDPERAYRLAWELFRKEKYSAAREQFDAFLRDPGEASQEAISNARYYKALCAGELFHPEASNEIREFVEQDPVSLKSELANFHAGKIFYRSHKYRKAVNYFEGSDISYLSNEEISEYWFKKGYSHFRLKEYDKASQCFNEILNVDSRYKTAATYYYGHVAYQQGNLNTAIETFDKLKDSKTFKPVLPYYYIQIYYEQEKYDEVVRYASTIEEDEKMKYGTEIKRYVAESHYKLGNYSQALGMFLEFERNFPRLSREDHYQIAYCYYQNKQYEEAIPYFEKVINVKDQLQQVAYFNLADCFLQTGKKNSARNAFQFASTAEFDKAIREESLFSYSKLSFELDFQPVAINSLHKFITEFPESSHIDEANEILAQLYITTRNYKDALEALDKIKDKSPRARKAYQKVAYFRGIEFFNDRDYKTAIDLFTKAIVSKEDELIRAQAMYWKAEAFYNLRDYEQARKQYRIYFFNPPSINTGMYHTAQYNLGYCHFKMGAYADASTWFRKYTRKKEATDPQRYSDALIRIADGYFMEKNYEGASTNYDLAIKSNAKATDYCLYQRGMIAGIRGDMTGKASYMKQIVTDHPDSRYIISALYENGNALIAEEKYEEADKLFKQIVKKYSKSEYAKKALLKTALIQYNIQNDENALAIYKEVVAKYPSTTESTEALTGIRNIYVGSGRSAEYFEYVSGVSSVSISTGAQDSITYEAAEQLYLKGEFDAASKGFTDYIRKFSNGYYILNATFYKAECDYRASKMNEALEGYLTVTSSPRNLFTEKSLLRSGEILEKQRSCAKAIEVYRELEQIADLRDNIIAAQTGLMRCHHLMEDHENTIIYARKLIEGEKIPVQTVQEAHLLYGRSALAKNDFTAAKREFGMVAKGSSGEATAEAKYSLGLIQFKNGEFKLSQDQCYKVINQVPSYEYWIGKSFILLGDNYLALGDTFQAKHTYKSIMDNYNGDADDKEDLISIAQEKYNTIIEKEVQKQQSEIQRKEEEFYNAEMDTTETPLEPEDTINE